MARSLDLYRVEYRADGKTFLLFDRDSGEQVGFGFCSPAEADLEGSVTARAEAAGDRHESLFNRDGGKVEGVDR